VLQPQFLTALNPEERIPGSQPLRAIQKFCDEALRRLRPVSPDLWSGCGRALPPPQPSGGRSKRPRQPGARPECSAHTPRTVGADKGSHTKAFVQQCRDMGVRRPVAPIESNFPTNRHW